MSQVPVVPVWTSPQKTMPPVGATVLCMLRHHSTKTIQEHSLVHVKEDDQCAHHGAASVWQRMVRH